MQPKKFDTKKNKVINDAETIQDAGTTTSQALSLATKMNGANDVSTMKKYYSAKNITAEDNTIDTGSFVVLKSEPSGKHYEVININNEGDVELRDTSSDAVISKSKQDLLPIITENTMNTINEAQYSVSINGLETQDADTLSQMLSLASQAEQGNVGGTEVIDATSITPEAPSPFDDPELNADATMDMQAPELNAYANPEMGDTAVVPTDALTSDEPEMDMPEEQPAMEVSDIPTDDGDLLEGCGKKAVKEEEKEEIIEKPEEEVSVEEIDEEVQKYLDEVGCCCGKKKVKEEDDEDEEVKDVEDKDANIEIPSDDLEQPQPTEEKKVFLAEEDPENYVVKKFKATGIDWDLESDGEEQDAGLPSEMEVEVEVSENASDDEIADKVIDELSNQTGWAVKGCETIEPAINPEEDIDEAVNEFLRTAGVKLEEEKVENAKPEIVNDETLIANKEDALGTKAGEEQRPEYQEEKNENTWGKDSSKGSPKCSMKMKEMVDMTKIKSICETAHTMYHKKGKEDWLFLDRRYIGKLMKEGVSYSNASKMLLIAKK